MANDHMVIWESENYRVLYRRDPQNYELMKAIGNDIAGDMQWERTSMSEGDMRRLAWEMIIRLGREVKLSAD